MVGFACAWPDPAPFGGDTPVLSAKHRGAGGGGGLRTAKKSTGSVRMEFANFLSPPKKTQRMGYSGVQRQGKKEKKSLLCTRGFFILFYFLFAHKAKPLTKSG